MNRNGEIRHQKKRTNYDFRNLENLVEEGKKLGLDVQELADKIASVKHELQEDLVRIVLLGSFSDGKTSAVAGLLGRLEKSMKIDIDESSDELTIYRPDGLKTGFEIVDTPGLFGTKDKEIDGKNVKFSSITEKYISQAHIVLYVCEAVNPIKASHLPIIKRVIRDYGKLENTVFIINKMDSVCDTNDADDFADMERIKKENLISRLHSEIQLTDQEESSLNVVCIAADPKGKGLEYWFANSADYMKRSHIGTLRKTLDNVVEKVNKTDVQSNAVDASVKDVVVRLSKALAVCVKPVENSLAICSDEQNALNKQFKLTSDNLRDNRNFLFDKLNSCKNRLLTHIDSSSINTIGSVIEQELGVQDDKVTFYILYAEVNTYIRDCTESNFLQLEAMNSTIEVSLSKQNKVLGEALKRGIKTLAPNITNSTVLAARNFLKLPIKFKPWGAIKLAKGLGIAIQVATYAIEWIIKWKREKKFNALKNELKKAINDYFSEMFQVINDDDAYYKTFAPSYLEMQNLLHEKDKEILNLKYELQKIKDYKNNLSKFYGRDITDVEYNEID